MCEFCLCQHVQHASTTRGKMLLICIYIYVPSTHAYTHVLRLSLDLPYEKKVTLRLLKLLFLGSECGRVV